MESESCRWCGLTTSQCGGPVHKYLESSPGCWAAYGELLAREYENQAYMASHQLTVDSYALQHPGGEKAQTRSSAYVHLASLYSYFVLNQSMAELPSVRQRLARRKNAFTWLEPPAEMKAITVADVLTATSATQHRTLVTRWARYIFEQWKPHHALIASMLNG